MQVMNLINCLLVFLLFCTIGTGCAQMKAGMEDLANQLNKMSFTSHHETVTAAKLNLREEPSTQSHILDILKKGDQLMIRSHEGPWVQVETTSHRIGWVHTAYVTGFTADSPANQSPAQADSQRQEDAAGFTSQDNVAQPVAATSRKITVSSSVPTNPPPANNENFETAVLSTTKTAPHPPTGNLSLKSTAPQKLISQQTRTVAFKCVTEPRERAFTVLIPAGWRIDGGIVRVDPLARGGPAQSIAAKVDFTIKNDPAGTVMERWLPDISWFDPRRSPAGQMGLMPMGSNYMGMTVMPLTAAQNFLSQVVFPRYHPGAGQINIVDSRQLPELSKAYHQAAYKVVPMLAGQLRYDAALIRVTYREGNVRYKEMLVTVIEDMGAAGAGMWSNKLTFFIRAPEKEYARWEPIFAEINHSVRINPIWMAGEVKGQLIRNKILDKTQKEIQRIGREIAEHRYRTNAEIQNDMFLTLTEQEEYVNPYTKEVEIGTNQWNYRWVNGSNDVIYTSSEDYNPNTDPNHQYSGYKRTPIRKRFPQ
jgi:Bacterial SH3 domain